MDLWDYALGLQGVSVPQLRNYFQKQLLQAHPLNNNTKNSIFYRIWRALRSHFENTVGVEPGSLYSHFNYATKLS